jgi:flagellar biosynthesis regulator FlbT
MTNSRFKELLERNKGNLSQLTYEYFCEEGSQIPINTFQQMFPMFLMMMNHGDVDGGLKKIEQYLKNKHEYDSKT